jgi:hypothetical protein
MRRSTGAGEGEIQLEGCVTADSGERREPGPGRRRGRGISGQARLIGHDEARAMPAAEPTQMQSRRSVRSEHLTEYRAVDGVGPTSVTKIG